MILRYSFTLKMLRNAEFVTYFVILHYSLRLNLSQGFLYGRHFPAGESAVNYIYSAEHGTWKQMERLEYIWNYYEHYATPSHPYDKSALISAANGSATFTARDANGYLLCDRNKNLEIDPEESNCGFAFHEHRGKGVNGSSRGNPFTQFWLDDNWLARYMSEAYGRPNPQGLVDHPGSFMRWKVIGSDTEGWNPYNSDHFDTLALDGLYYIARGDITNAIRVWNRSLVKSGARFNSEFQQFEYPQIHENYHMGLWKIFTEQLAVEKSSLTNQLYNTIIQHSVSLRSQILNNQEKDENGNLCGWISNIGVFTSLINTEGVSINSLALAANSKYIFEAADAPMKVGSGNYFVRSYHVVSAVVGLSASGIMSAGPDFPLQRGSYTIQFCFRSPNPVDNIAYVDIYDSSTTQVIRSQAINSADFAAGGNQWILASVPIDIHEDGHLYEFRTYFYGISNLDIAYVSVR